MIQERLASAAKAVFRGENYSSPEYVRLARLVPRIKTDGVLTQDGHRMDALDKGLEIVDWDRRLRDKMQQGKVLKLGELHKLEKAGAKAVTGDYKVWSSEDFGTVLEISLDNREITNYYCVNLFTGGAFLEAKINGVKRYPYTRLVTPVGFTTLGLIFPGISESDEVTTVHLLNKPRRGRPNIKAYNKLSLALK